jgi:hypothetical protein
MPRDSMKIFRDIKTEALLVYIKTLCNDYIKKIENEDYKIDLGNPTYNEEITQAIYFLKNNFSSSVFDAYELKLFVDSYLKEARKKILPPQYNALLYFYNNIVSEFDKSFKAGDIWIPEQVIFSLLSEWIYEEEKSVKRYPYLLDIDYFKLLGYFENARNNETQDDMKQNIRFMYEISSGVINKLKHLKLNKTTKSKTKRKK